MEYSRIREGGRCSRPVISGALENSQEFNDISIFLIRHSRCSGAWLPPWLCKKHDHYTEESCQVYNNHVVYWSESAIMSGQAGVICLVHGWFGSVSPSSKGWDFPKGHSCDLKVLGWNSRDGTTALLLTGCAKRTRHQQHVNLKALAGCCCARHGNAQCGTEWSACNFNLSPEDTPSVPSLSSAADCPHCWSAFRNVCITEQLRMWKRKLTGGPHITQKTNILSYWSTSWHAKPRRL